MYFPYNTSLEFLSVKNTKLLTQLNLYTLFYHHSCLQITMYLYLQEYTYYITQI